jgi:hypothetical protein
MDRAHLNESLNSFRLDLVEAEERAQLALAEVDALRKIIEGVEALMMGRPTQLVIQESGTIVGRGQTNGTSAVTGEDAPRGQEAVRRLLIESRREWKRSALIQEILRRGWINPAAKHKQAAVGTALDRLVKDGEVERVPDKRATYRYPPDKLPPTEDRAEVPISLTPGGGSS